MFTSKTLGEVTAATVNELPGPGLAELYNELIEVNGEGKPVKKFADRKAGIRRVNVELHKYAQNRVDESGTPKAAAEPKVSRERGRISYPQQDRIGHHRPSTRRGKVIRLCTTGGGRTIAQLIDECDGWDEKDVRVCLKHINSYLGHGVEEGEDGVIRITGTPRGRKPFDLEADEKPKELRPNTKRKRTFDLLSRPNGATVDEVREATGWNYEQALEGIKLLHVYCGYGLCEDDDGHIKVFS